MIPSSHVTGWRQQNPWPDDAQVEQDLIICRALVEIFQQPGLYEAFAFRGGTALHKLHVRKPIRYSEDECFGSNGVFGPGQVKKSFPEG